MNALNRPKVALLTVLALVAGLLVVSTGSALAKPKASRCTVTVTAPDSIQDAIDTNPGGTVCLDDSLGVFNQSVVFGPEDSNVKLTAEPGDTPVLDGSSGSVLVNAIRLDDGVSRVTIEGLEIRNYKDPTPDVNSRNSAISAWDVSTSRITVRNNNLHDNTYNGILVGSEGGFIHDNWKVEGNTVSGHGFVGIELTNCLKCKITKNSVDTSGFAGIVVQARNTVAGSGAVAIKDVKVEKNTITDAGFAGIYVLSITAHPTAFTPITGASSLLEKVKVKGNTITDSGAVAIRFWAFNDAATATKSNIEKNSLDCLPSTPGIEVLERGSGETGDVEKVKIKKNTFDTDCAPPITDEQ